MTPGRLAMSVGAGSDVGGRGEGRKLDNGLKE